MPNSPSQEPNLAADQTLPNDLPVRAAGASPATVAVSLGVVAAIVLAVFWPALRSTALWFDDDQYLTENKLVQNPSWAAARTFFAEVRKPSTVRGYYQPLAMVSLMLDSALGG